jgi:hypothetical protein
VLNAGSHTQSKKALARIRELEADSKLKLRNDEKIEISSYLKTHISQRRLFWTMKIATGEVVYTDIQSIKSFIVDERFKSIDDPLDRAILFGVEFKNVHLYQISGLEGTSTVMQSPVQEKYSDSTDSLHEYQLAEKELGPIVDRINPVHYYNTLLKDAKGRKSKQHEAAVQLKPKQKKRKRRGKNDSKSTGMLSTKLKSTTKGRSSNENSFRDLMKLFRVSGDRLDSSPKPDCIKRPGRVRSSSVSRSRATYEKDDLHNWGIRGKKEKKASKRTRSIEQSRVDSLAETRLTYPESKDITRSSGIWNLLKESNMKRVSF